MGHHRKRIVLIEDEEDIAAFVKLQLEGAGYHVRVAFDGLSGFDAVSEDKPDLVLLDLMLPGQNGLEVCRKIKGTAHLKHIPIMMLTAQSEEVDIVLGLEMGADDYITKPFSPKVLLSRIKAVLRRGEVGDEPTKTFAFGEFVIDIDRYLLKKNGTIQQLTLSEFGILSLLIKHRGEVLSRNQLLKEIQEEGAFIVDRNVDVHIASLRKKLGPRFEWIETVRGLGYRFRE